MYQVNVDLGLLQENNLTKRVYARESTRFCAVALDAPIRYCRIMALFYKESQQFVAKPHKQHVPNVINFKVVIGGRRWHVVGHYLTPCDASTLDSVVAVIGQRPRGAKLLIYGDLNTDLELLDGHKCNEAVVVEMNTEGLEDMMEHFLLRKLPRTRYSRT